MIKYVLDVGNCTFDHSIVKRLIESNFDVQVSRAHGECDALQALQTAKYQLILINRVLHRDGQDGLELIRRIKSDPDLASTPVMLITNIDEYQVRATEAGAERGFGKATLHSPETRERLEKLLTGSSLSDPRETVYSPLPHTQYRDGE